MLYQDVTNISFESFRELSQDKKVILLYPWTNYRNLFLTYFLDDTRDGLLYYRIPEEQEHLTTWLKGLIDELDAVLGGFGEQLRNSIEHSNAAGMGAALARDLNAYAENADRVVLFIDEMDRVPHDSDFRSFVDSLVRELPPRVQLAVNSRLLTYQPWVSMVERGDAVVLGTEHRRDNLMFTTEDIPKPQLEVYAFGRGHALVNGQQIENWDGALPRNLFFYFVDNELVTRNQIFDVFWPNLNIKEATNVFHVTKRKITERISSKVLEKGNFELTQYSAGFYVPGNKVVRHYDVADFEEAVERAMVSDNEREQAALFRRAIDIHKAPFLQTISMPWVLDRREKLRLMYCDALIGMGRLHKKNEEYEDALGYFIRSLKEMPQREDIYREVMLMYWKLHRHQDAVDQYHMLQAHLDKSVGVPPSKETRDLFEEIQAEIA